MWQKNREDAQKHLLAVAVQGRGVDAPVHCGRRKTLGLPAGSFRKEDAKISLERQPKRRHDRLVYGET